MTAEKNITTTTTYSLLNLTAVEVSTLLSILDRVYGSPTNSARYHVDKIANSLTSMGVKEAFNHKTNMIDGSIFFKDYK